MGKPKKLQQTGTYTSNMREGVITVTAPSDVHLPQGFNLLIKGKNEKAYFWLVKQKTNKAK